MQPKWLNGIGAVPVLAALLVLATGAGTGRAGLPPGNADAPKPLPEEVVTAWKEAGATVGWVRVQKLGSPVGMAAGLQEVDALKPVHVLDLRFAQVTDAGLKELAALKSLHSLSLRFTQVTNAGLKELAGLKSLHSL